MTFQMNLKPVISVLNEWEDKVKESIGGALYVEANDIMAKSKRIVPVDTGVLRNSGTVDAPEIDDHGVSVEFGYGGAASAYALVQHEDLTLKHKDGKSAKYLEIPVLQAKDGMGRRVEARVRRSGRASGETSGED